MSITLPNLPYDKSALEPHISAKTLDFHHGKHHQAYVTNLNKLIDGTEYASQDLDSIIMASHGDATKAGIFNNAAQVWNHTFYWNCMKPNGGGKPGDDLMNKINNAFGSFEAFKTEFHAAAISQFGSGWAWLVLDGNDVKIVKTPNAGLPMTANQKALLTCDVWEHAYYLDYQNRRPDYVTTFLEHLVNWDFVEKTLRS